jgi:murein L,D-transpeptidase YafK
MDAKRRPWLVWSAAGLAVVFIAGAASWWLLPEAWKAFMPEPRPKRAPAAAAAAALPALFAEKGCPHPPARLALVAIKDERRLELWAPGAGGEWRLVKEYPVLAASGRAGPKLREGDRQVPEGLYRVVFLNPKSKFHLSMQIDYPNEFDREMGRRDGREALGGEIFIHGEAVSIGCLAIGNPAIEELYALVEATGKERVRVLIAPWDLRKPGAALAPPPGAPEWAGGLYERLRGELAPFVRE